MPSANKDEPEIHAGAGQPDQLPAGQAAEANRGLEAARTSATASRASNASSSPPAAQEPAGAPEQPPQLPQPFRPGTEEDKFLYGPTARPQEPLLAGLTAAGRTAPPEELANHPGMALLMHAAQVPGASPEVQALAQAFAHFLGQ